VLEASLVAATLGQTDPIEEICKLLNPPAPENEESGSASSKPPA
jgi:hypothetical protein